MVHREQSRGRDFWDMSFKVNQSLAFQGVYTASIFHNNIVIERHDLGAPGLPQDISAGADLHCRGESGQRRGVPKGDAYWFPHRGQRILKDEVVRGGKESSQGRSQKVTGCRTVTADVPGALLHQTCRDSHTDRINSVNYMDQLPLVSPEQTVWMHHNLNTTRTVLRGAFQAAHKHLGCISNFPRPISSTQFYSQIS
jgi:hypothetical protein